MSVKTKTMSFFLYFFFITVWTEAFKIKERAIKIKWLFEDLPFGVGNLFAGLFYWFFFRNAIWMFHLANLCAPKRREKKTLIDRNWLQSAFDNDGFSACNVKNGTWCSFDLVANFMSIPEEINKWILFLSAGWL